MNPTYSYRGARQETPCESFVFLCSQISHMLSQLISLLEMSLHVQSYPILAPIFQ